MLDKIFSDGYDFKVVTPGACESTGSIYFVDIGIGLFIGSWQ